MGNAANSSSQVISLPQGGGAIRGIGEKFSPDLFTGTGNFSVPLALPPGRNGFHPQLSLVYSTGQGNGPFGLGWGLSIPGVSRQTSKGIPRYHDYDANLRQRDVFVLSGAEDLVPVEEGPGLARYRPRTEGPFARILHHHAPGDNYWEVRSKDGLVSCYGTPSQAGRDPVVVADPARRDHVFAWKLALTEDPFHNRIEYEYRRDRGQDGPHAWDQLYLKEIRYVDYPDSAGQMQFLVKVELEFQDYPDPADPDRVDPRDLRPDPFSDYKAGFEIRTRMRCKRIHMCTYPNGTRTPVRTYQLVYLDERTDLPDLEHRLPPNRVSLLSQVVVIGYDDAGKAYSFSDADPQARQEALPPLEFGYTAFDVQGRRFQQVTGADLPSASLADPSLELVDLHGSGLPDILEMNGTVRSWRNLGGGCFDLPRPMRDAPPNSLSQPGVQMLDANGDGRMDLLVTAAPLAGYYPLANSGGWARASFQKYHTPPAFDLKDPEVRLLDLTGDGVTDAVRAGSSLEIIYNDPLEGWSEIVPIPRRSALEAFPDVTFSDPRVRLADMTGDGLQDIALVYDGNVEYWPNLGYGRWGKRVSMRRSPRFRDLGYTLNYDPRRILTGDMDGDGLADLVYVGDRQVTVWINQAGNAWSEPRTITGTPPVTDLDAVRLVDLLGNGISGVLWSAEARPGSRQPCLYFLDLTGGVKPYVLTEMDNHMGSLTRVQYASSTRFYLADAQKPATRWQTPLPFPVQVVERVEVIDAISRSKLATQYHYHHGYWDGAEREFRGFGMVEQVDSEAFVEYQGPGLHGGADFLSVSQRHFSPPTLTKSWFHQGPVGEEFGDWQELDRSAEYWAGDPELLEHTLSANRFLAGYPGSPGGRRIKRDALRALRGSLLRTELYALDRYLNQNALGPEDRPYTITEHAYGLREEEPPPVGQAGRQRIFFVFPTAQRTTQWERGDDPMTQFGFTGEYDAFGQAQRQTAVAMPRRSAKRRPVTGAVVGAVDPDETRVLATHAWTSYAVPNSSPAYIHDRAAQTRTYELVNPPQVTETDSTSARAVLLDQWRLAKQIHDQFRQGSAVRLIAHEVHHYDGPAFAGLAAGQIDQYGALARSEALVLTGELLDEAYAGDPGEASRRPAYLGGTRAVPNGAPQGFGAGTGYRLESAGAVYEDGYYADTKRIRFDFQNPPARLQKGLPVAAQDALGHETQITPDAIWWYLAEKVRDAAGMETSSVYNPRTLQPAAVTGPNGDVTQYRYNPTGLVSKVWLEANDGQGGSAAKPELSYSCDFLNFETNGEPVFVHTTARVYHANVAGPSFPHSDEVIETREYSDGFGRLVQKRAQAEDLVFGATGDDVGLLVNGKAVAGQVGSARAAADTATDRVAVSGWQVYDNKGRVTEKYEPFFDLGWTFQGEAGARKGQRELMFYDPRGQVTRTLHPDGSETRVIFGVPGRVGAVDLKHPEAYEPTPWESYTYDANDLAQLTFHPDPRPGYGPWPEDPPQPLTDVAQDAAHYFTPTSAVLDGLARVICQVQRNGPVAAQDWYVTRSTYDVRGNLLDLVDPLERAAFRHAYDLLNRPLRVDSIDAALRTLVLDAQGNLIEYRDSKGSIVLREYDALNRPVGAWAIDNASAVQNLTWRERIVYGDQSGLADAQARHLFGKPYIHYDEAGKQTFERYDFTGNLVEKNRRVVSDAAIAGGWGADWSGAPVNESALEVQDYQTSTTYDALNRPLTIIYPADGNGHWAVLAPVYNRAGALQSVKLDGETYVDFIAYNVKGQRVLVVYGNDLMTRYAYDPHTFRLVRLRTEAFVTPRNANEWRGQGAALQDFTYQYDLAGNLTTLQDRTPASGVPNTLLGADALDRAFTYDPIYRLLTATGREAAAAQPAIWDDPFQLPGAGQQDPTLTSPYTHTYQYDPAGNLRAQRNGATKTFTLANNHNGAGSNRLATVTAGKNPATQVTYQYQYDRSGNLIKENSERFYVWDEADRLAGFRHQASAATPPSVEARYLYDSAGMRVKKWVRTNGTGPGESTTYIDGIFEHLRWQKNGQAGETNILHVMDNQSRVAQKRVGQKHPDDGGPDVQYCLGDHLGSNSLVIGGADARTGAFINREEFYPYGETSFGSIGKKRYRFTGKERDEESGLNYHGARYYAPWLGRWASCDPAGKVDGPNLYQYVTDNPVILFDSSGRQEEGRVENVNLPKNILGGQPSVNDLSRAAHRAAQVGQEMQEKQALNHAQGKKGPYVGTEWARENPNAIDRLNRNKDEPPPEQVNCITLPLKSMQVWDDELLLPSGDVLGLAADSSGADKKVESARGTTLLQAAHDKRGFHTLGLFLDKDDKNKELSQTQRRGYYPAFLLGKQKFVKGALTGKPVDVTVKVDEILSNFGSKAVLKKWRQAMDRLKEVPYAIGVVDHGNHTFILSYGQVWEIHFAQGPASQDILEKTPVEQWLVGNSSAVIAVPPGPWPYGGMK